MGRMMLKNFCIEPTQRDCSCTIDIRCGGIIEPAVNCPEHGLDREAPVLLMETHFHAVQGDEVGQEAERRYDYAKAS